jgi:hypothetical protein
MTPVATAIATTMGIPLAAPATPDSGTAVALARNWTQPTSAAAAPACSA